MEKPDSLSRRRFMAGTVAAAGGMLLGGARPNFPIQSK